MKIYLAGGITGNLISFWKDVMKIYLSGGYSRPYIIKEAMKIYLAGGNIGYKWAGDYDLEIIKHKPYILESYFYIKDNYEWLMKMKPFFKDFMLDSGAFSFFGKKNIEMDWIKYTEEYCDFINKYNIDNFIELDIEKLTSMELVEELREIIIKKTKKKPIPVWRPSRGIDYWYKMIKEYDYVSISASGMFDSGWARKKGAENILYKLIKEAKKENCKVHGLGYTNLKLLHQVPFYSVDSTAWLYGNRGGYIYHFNGETIKQIQLKNKKLIGRPAAVHNFNEWIKFQKYADLYY